MENIDRKRFKPMKGIVMYRFHINRQFAAIREYVKETSGLIINEQRKVEKFINKELDGIENDDRARGVIEFYIEDISKYEETYTELLMNSTFVTAFSLFETSFLRVCKYGKLEKNVTLSATDRRDNSIIYKCKNYIEKDLEIDLKKLNTDWQVLTDYNKIRNLIVHNVSNFRKDKTKPLEDQKLHSLIVKNPFIKQKDDKHGYFYIRDNQFIIDFCDKAEKFLLDIIELILKNGASQK